MITGFFTLTFIISFFCLFKLLYSYGNRISKYFVLLFVCVTVTNYGYIFFSKATEFGEALLAKKIVYLGASFVPFFLYMSVSELCKIEAKKLYHNILLTFALAINTLIMTVENHSLYYRNPRFEFQDGVGVIVKEYGILYWIFPIYLLLAIALNLINIIKAIKKRNDVSGKSMIVLLVAMILVTGTYIVERLLNLNVEIIPFAYAVCIVIILGMIRRISMYDIWGYAAESISKGTDYGFILLDEDNCFLGGNDEAFEWFPELKDVKIDTPIFDYQSSMNEFIMKWIGNNESSEKYVLPVEGKFIELSNTIIIEKDDVFVRCISMHDVTEQQKYNLLSKRYNEDLSIEVNAKTQKLKKILNDIIVSMANIVESRDENTGGHIARTSDIVRLFVDHLQLKGTFKELTDEVCDCIVRAAPLHDFGKISIPDEILNKPGKFTDEEYEKMKQHSAKGAVIVNEILTNTDDEAFKEIAVNVAHYHHEKWDGNGYPDRIKDTDIPIEARIMALADVFDALVSKRVYKDAFSYDRAFEIIKESSGSHFDPDLCEEFLECRDELEALYDSYF